MDENTRNPALDRSMVKLAPGRSFYLKRQRDGVGDSGPCLRSLKWPEGKDQVRMSDLIPTGGHGEIHVGCKIECGAITARTYGMQDFWLTTEVTEFLDVVETEDGVTKVTFQTRNSVYEAGVI